jgi:uncharacterized protein (DUF2252 family)
MPPTSEIDAFPKANRAFERWLGGHLDLIASDLRRKHAAMAEDLFSFLRATYFRWAQHWPVACRELVTAPQVLAVGDLHIENFGTWRDIEGRLVWGVNDLDEAWPLPYTNDLVRVAASALLAAKGGQLSVDRTECCEALLDGYSAALAEGGRPFVLAERHGPLREMAVARLKDSEAFWAKLDALRPMRTSVPRGAKKALGQLLPEGNVLPVRYVHRLAGLGSLGRQRIAAIAEWRGGKVAREAKALAPSANAWAEDAPASATTIYYQRLLDRAVRCPDPFVRVKRRWVVRRLAPDCSRIPLTALPHERDEVRLLRAMGWEAANIHLGSARAKTLRADLRARGTAWLAHAARRMAELVEADFEAWREHIEGDAARA